MKVIIAEKPSYANTIAEALRSEGNVMKRENGYFSGKDYFVTWQFGHLFRLYTIEEYQGSTSKIWNEDILPYIPKQFKFRLKEDKGIKEQYQVIRKLINDSRVTEIVEAGDNDDEGVLLTSLTVADILRRDNINKKRTKLWSSDQSIPTILESLHNLKSVNEYIMYSNSAYTRTCMDFLLGINLTRKFTLVNRRLTNSREVFSIGRCNTSIVKIVYDRDYEIKNFKPEKYIQLESEEETKGEKVKLVNSEKFTLDRKDTAEKLAEELNTSKAIVNNIENKTVSKIPPKLFSLSKLQGVLSDRYKMTMESSLKLIQNLYERGYITYPRTNSEYLSTEEKPKIQKVLEDLKAEGHNVMMVNSKRIFDNSKIESHSALIITSKRPTETDLNTQEKIVYKTIKNRFLANFTANETKVDQTIMDINVGETKFTLKGEVIRKKGFFEYEPLPKSKETNRLPNLQVGDELVVNFKLVNKATKPPAKLTIKALNNILKNPFAKEYKNAEEEYKDILEGVEIGTEATRTGIISNAKKYGYIVENKGVISIAEKGIYLIETLDKLNINLSKDKTVEFSRLIKKVFRNEIKPLDGVNTISKELKEMFNNIQNTEIKGFVGNGSKLNSEKEVIGMCPKCGKPVYESKKSFYCSGFNQTPKCDFSLWKENKFFNSKGKKLGKITAKKLLKDGKALVKGFKTKEMKSYDATVIMEVEGKYPKFTLEFND